MSHGQSAEIVDFHVSFGFAAELGNEDKRAQLHQGVNGKIVEHRSDSQFHLIGSGRRRERHENISGVRNGAVGQHPLDIGLRDGRQIAYEHCQRGGNP